MTVITTKQASVILDVSAATVQNWVKHGYLSPVQDTKSTFIDSDVTTLKRRIESGEIQRLRNRANKKNSSHSFIPEEYVGDEVFVHEVEKIRETVITHKLDVELSLFFLALKQLVLMEEVSLPSAAAMPDFELFINWKRKSVKREFESWHDLLNKSSDSNRPFYKNIYDSLTDISHDDTLGIIYQSILLEGSKSKRGAYYTPGEIVDSIFADYPYQDGKFLDPCCGTGQFILGAVRAGYSNPEELYGYDIDRIAVQIARINVLLSFPFKEFQPQIYTLNTLTDISNGTLFCDTNCLTNSFALIATNPPWGAASNKNDREMYTSLFPHIASSESFSFFLSKCLDLVRDKGRISFILPESILNIRVHSDIRSHILNTSKIEAIHCLGRKFKGVFTPTIRLDIVKEKAPADWNVTVRNTPQEIMEIPQSRFRKNPHNIFDISLSNEDSEIISLLYARPYLTLDGNAEWALGIVTGDNKRFLKKEKTSETEPVYKGSDIEKYRLKKPTTYIKFKPKLFQQVAPENKYRADEKLIYKFISNKLVFAYDTKGSLTINSANILLPRLDDFPAKLLLGFLNSSLYQFMFSKKFSTLKVLRGDLEALPFPIPTDPERKNIIDLVDQAINGEDVQHEIDLAIMNIAGLSSSQVNIVTIQKASIAGIRVKGSYI